MHAVLFSDGVLLRQLDGLLNTVGPNNLSALYMCRCCSNTRRRQD